MGDSSEFVIEMLHITKRFPGIVANDGSYIGYHVMYFVGTDIPYWQVQVKSAMMSKDYNDWMNSLTENVTATEAGGMKYVG